MSECLYPTNNLKKLKLKSKFKNYWLSYNFVAKYYNKNTNTSKILLLQFINYQSTFFFFFNLTVWKTVSIGLINYIYFLVWLIRDLNKGRKWELIINN